MTRRRKQNAGKKQNGKPLGEAAHFVFTNLKICCDSAQIILGEELQRRFTDAARGYNMRPDTAYKIGAEVVKILRSQWNVGGETQSLARFAWKAFAKKATTLGKVLPCDPQVGSTDFLPELLVELVSARNSEVLPRSLLASSSGVAEN